MTPFISCAVLALALLGQVVDGSTAAPVVVLAAPVVVDAGPLEITVPAPAVTAPTPGGKSGNEGGLVSVFRNAARGQKWLLMLGAGLMLLVIAARKAMSMLRPDVIPVRFMPYVSLFLASAPTIAVAFMAEDIPWDDLLGLFFAAWFMAGGMWSNPKAMLKGAPEPEAPSRVPAASPPG